MTLQVLQEGNGFYLVMDEHETLPEGVIGQYLIDGSQWMELPDVYPWPASPRWSYDDTEGLAVVTVRVRLPGQPWEITTLRWPDNAPVEREAAPPPASNDLVDRIHEAIVGLPASAFSAKDGKPRCDALAKALQEPVSAADRDAAWARHLQT